MTLFIGILEEGLIYAIMALGVYITYKILDFPDLSVDSTFPMGAALTASAILAGINPVLTLFLAFGAGALAGCVTGLIPSAEKLSLSQVLEGRQCGPGRRCDRLHGADRIQSDRKYQQY